MFLGDVGVGDKTKNTFNEDVNPEEGSGDSKKNSIPNFVDDMSNMLAGVNVSVNTSNLSSGGKRKATQNCSSKSVNKREALGWERNFFRN